MDRPLSDLLVLDLTRALAGPIAGRLLSDLGADVVKVEPPAGDLTRATKPRQDSMAVYFVQANVGKRCVSIDLTTADGRDLFLTMAERADIVLENFRPGVMDRLGLGYEALSAVNPRIILASVSGYGHGNVWSHRGAFAAAVQAETGLTADIAKRRGVTPRNDPVSQADVYGGLHALAAILAAVHHRDRTGEGQAVDVDMAEATLVANDMTTTNLRPDHEVTDGFRSGSNWPPCYQLATGRWVTVTADPAVEGSFRAWCNALGRPELREDPRFTTMAGRLEHAAELDAMIAEWIAKFETAAEVEEAIGFSTILVADVRTAPEIHETDWAEDRGAFVDVPVKPGSAPVTVPQSPWRFSKSPTGAVPRVGFRGQHNREVLGEVLGLSAEQVDDLEARDVISARLPSWLSDGTASGEK
ncbi:MAG: CoA transferase [Acidimicrobiia bacterium]|nr:CoA transferase [Acidimicrobiia bacterium]